MSGDIGAVARRTQACLEAEGLLVGPPGFKPEVPVTSWKVGSIPMRLHHHCADKQDGKKAGDERSFQVSAFRNQPSASGLAAARP